MRKTWFITGATRGLGLEIANAALRAGDRVVATGRKLAAVAASVGRDGDELLCLELDVCDAEEPRAAVRAAVEKFGGIDVLVNNAGYGHLGFFEETTPADVAAQFETNVFGVFNVCRAALPVMRAARRGLIYNMSSVAGVRGNEFGSLYSASKFALEGFSESLAKEVAPFGIAVSIVEPGPFRTDFLTDESLRYGGNRIADYDERRAKVRASFEARNHRQPGDPVKLADAMVRLSREAKPPLRFAAGAFAVKTIGDKLAEMSGELERWRQVSIDTDFSP
jgi:NAD(P)-dependent dehydrogenase (short-subunit alcohol dehydrogenase family)